MLPSTTVVAVFAVAHAERLNTPSSFMLVGGVSARSEMCLMGLENVGASLSCRAAVAELDGRERACSEVFGCSKWCGSRR